MVCSNYSLLRHSIAPPILLKFSTVRSSISVGPSSIFTSLGTILSTLVGVKCSREFLPSAFMGRQDHQQDRG
jgi:hypothetical protein